MAFDQGTTSSRCIIFAMDGKIVSQAQKEHRQFFPQIGWVEHDPIEIWSNQLSVAVEAMAKIDVRSENIAAIGITNQRETTVVWDRHTGRPIYNAIVWQCRRTSDICDRLKTEGFDKVIKKKTGLATDAYFSGTKLAWILENVPGARESANRGDLLFGTIDTWLMWQLTRGTVFATDYSNASRTMLFNIHTLQWDREILEHLNIPAQILPVPLPSAHIFGKTSKEYFGGEIIISGVAGDQQAALFGQGCFEPGMVKNTYGTGCFTLMNTGETPVASQNGMLTTIAWGIGGDVEYALEGSVFVAGSLIQWLRDGLKMIESAAETETYAKAVDDTAGVYIVPAFVGLGAPYWNQHAKGIITGLTHRAKREHIVRAALEAIAYQSHDIISAMAADAGKPIGQVRVDGGASKNNFLMQFQSDILDISIRRPAITESTALGAAFLAALGSGIFTCKTEIAQILGNGQIFNPNMDEEIRQKLLSGWQTAIEMIM